MSLTLVLEAVVGGGERPAVAEPEPLGRSPDWSPAPWFRPGRMRALQAVRFDLVDDAHHVVAEEVRRLPRAA